MKDNNRFKDQRRANKLALKVYHVVREYKENSEEIVEIKRKVFKTRSATDDQQKGEYIKIYSVPASVEAEAKELNKIRTEYHGNKRFDFVRSKTSYLVQTVDGLAPEKSRKYKDLLRLPKKKELKVGMAVVHTILGEGLVEAVANGIIDVNFDGTTKKVMIDSLKF